MTSLCARCAKIPQIRVNLSFEEISRIEHDLRSEFGPFVIRPERAEEVKQMLALADKDIEDHDSEIARLHGQILIIEEGKRKLEAQRARLRALLSPVRKLPNEILSRIFQHVCENNSLRGYNAHTLPIHFSAMTISFVCSRWRDLALSSPRLWAHLTIGVCTRDAARELRLINILTRLLKRSSPLKLSLNIDCNDCYLREGTLPFLDLLLQHAHRWETFTFHALYPLTLYQMPSGLHFPSLVELNIRTFESPLGGPLPDLNLFEHAPRLCTLATTEAPPPKAPFNKLESLHLQRMNIDLASPPVLANILHNYPSLKSLSLEPDPFEEGDFEELRDPTVQGTWRNITCLVIEAFWQPWLLNMAFSSFSFPSLNELVVKSKCPTTWPVDAFKSFVTTSSCMITTFTLRGFTVSDVDLIATLQVMPSLSYLEIDDFKDSSSQSPITSHFMQSLQHQSTSFPLAPKLHSLRLISKWNAPFDDLTFISMIESRWFKPGSDLSAAMFSVGKACIRSVVLTFSWREVDAEV
ncbi:hypothetical protein BDP27DRAFT_1315869 [Rhodocollybia butyracea]|uniref:F-box domain-containing protein n=1 Tax=Rhodocollybia butyracea TaxID=206335 RepID=A0A9P5Q721_9AGAR|nr:hypothetical protein BDP27DRAFT_1315869 [Rhodocollybia butyracea]